MGSGASALEKASTSDVKEALASLNDEEQKKLGEALAKLDAKAEEPAPAEKKETAPADEKKVEAGAAELSEELKAKLQECFDAIDTNKNGSIEASEFKSVMNKLAVPLNDDQIEKVFTSVDLNKDKKLSFDEYVKLVSCGLNI
ncbi:SLC25A24 [Symbiodinium sp. CCMP2592]|nr:SLC25A24 [Symbiodinium sp. CCMP2592]